MSKAMTYSTDINEIVNSNDRQNKLENSLSGDIKHRFMTHEDNQQAIKNVITKSQLLFSQTMKLK